MINGERCSVFRRSLLNEVVKVTVRVVTSRLSVIRVPMQMSQRWLAPVTVAAFRLNRHMPVKMRAWQKTENNRTTKKQKSACDAEAVVRSRRVQLAASNGPIARPEGSRVSRFVCRLFDYGVPTLQVAAVRSRISGDCTLVGQPPSSSRTQTRC
jgi:hypothetical protein